MPLNSRLNSFFPISVSESRKRFALQAKQEVKGVYLHIKAGPKYTMRTHNNKQLKTINVDKKRKRNLEKYLFINA